MLTGTQDNDEIIERVAALDIGKADLVCCVRVSDEDHRGEAAAGGGDLLRDDPVAFRDGRSSGLPGGDPGGHGGHQRLLETGVLPAGGRRVRDLAGSAKDSSTCRGGRRPASWTRPGWPRSPSATAPASRPSRLTGSFRFVLAPLQALHLDSDLPRQDPAPVRGTGAGPGRRWCLISGDGGRISRAGPQGQDC